MRRKKLSRRINASGERDEDEEKQEKVRISDITKVGLREIKDSKR